MHPTNTPICELHMSDSCLLCSCWPRSLITSRSSSSKPPSARAPASSTTPQRRSTFHPDYSHSRSTESTLPSTHAPHALPPVSPYAWLATTPSHSNSSPPSSPHASRSHSSSSASNTPQTSRQTRAPACWRPTAACQPCARSPPSASHRVAQQPSLPAWEQPATSLALSFHNCSRAAVETLMTTLRQRDRTGSSARLLHLALSHSPQTCCSSPHDGFLHIAPLFSELRSLEVHSVCGDMRPLLATPAELPDFMSLSLVALMPLAVVHFAAGQASSSGSLLYQEQQQLGQLAACIFSIAGLQDLKIVAAQCLLSDNLAHALAESIPAAPPMRLTHLDLSGGLTGVDVAVVNTVLQQLTMLQRLALQSLSCAVAEGICTDAGITVPGLSALTSLDIRECHTNGLELRTKVRSADAHRSELNGQQRANTALQYRSFQEMKELLIDPAVVLFASAVAKWMSTEWNSATLPRTGILAHTFPNLGSLTISAASRPESLLEPSMAGFGSSNVSEQTLPYQLGILRHDVGHVTGLTSLRLEHVHLHNSDFLGFVTDAGSMQDHLRFNWAPPSPTSLARDRTQQPLRQLRLLSLRCSGLEDAGMASVAHMLSCLVNLTQLDLSHNRLKVPGAQQLAAALARATVTEGAPEPNRGTCIADISRAAHP
eukprot:jgi/Ulvmu1/1758/UM117_0035.1